MSFSNLPWAWGLLGAIAIAGVLYLLQRLRVRHQLVEVETTLFWQQAMEESRARVLVQRFRHPWAYALILAIALLLWLAVAGVRGGGNSQRDHVVLLDGSAAMAIGDRFPEAVALASDYAFGLPEDARTVVLCGGTVRTVLRPGEESLLLTRRLQDVQPDASANSIANVLHQFVTVRGDRPTTVCVVGEHSLSDADLALLPESIEVQQLKVQERTGSNLGITAFGVRPAASGTFHNVDVLVEVAGGTEASGAPTLALGGTAWGTAPEVSSSAVGSQYRYRDVPAHGQTLLASLPAGDALALDDRAQFVLPDRRPIAVAAQPGIAKVLRQVLTADSGIQLQDAVDAQTRVVIRNVGSAFGAQLPALELSTMEQAEDAFLVFHPEGLDPGAVLDELYRGLGLNEIDAMSTAAALGRAITMGAKPDDSKKLWVWRKLLQPDYDFVNSRSFPLFVGLSVRWLADFDEGPDRVAVGEPVAVGDVVVHHDALGASRSFTRSFVPGLAGSYSLASADAADASGGFAASLLDPQSTGVVDALVAELPAAATASASGYDLITICLFLALLLLGLEWLLFRTSRIP